MEALFETSLMGFSVKVYADRVEYKKGLLGSKTSIPVKQIASVEVGMPGLQKLILETSGGKKINLVVRLKDKDALSQAIHQAMNK